MAMSGWFVLGVAPRFEKRVQQSLELRKVESYTPRETVWVTAGRRRVAQAVPMFPGYVLVRLPVDARGAWRFEVVHEIEGVSGFVRRWTADSWMPAEVDGALVREMRDLEARGCFDRTVKPKLSFDPGMPVRVVAGPFSNVLARVLEAPEGDRIKVLLEGAFAGTATFSIHALEAA